MEKHLNKKLEETTNKLISGMDVEKPSVDFTASLMEHIHTLETNRVTQYKPLISKLGWMILSILLVITTVYIASTTNSSNIEWLNSVDFSVLTNNKVTNSFSSISLPKTVAYAIGLFGLMLCIQIPFLKHYFDKRLQF